MKAIDDEKFKYIVSALITTITLFGASALGVAILLSELLYPEIEEFSDCPNWYKTFLLTSLVVSAYGVICSFIFKRKSPRRLVYAYMVETKVFSVLLITGLLLMMTLFIDDENYVVDVIICVGGAVGAVGLFGLLSSLAARAVNKHGRPYVSLLLGLKNIDPHINITRPASKKSISKLEEYLGASLPVELKRVYDETDGDGALLFSPTVALGETKAMREKYSADTPEVNNLFFFGIDEFGTYVCYRIINGKCIEDAIVIFDTETGKIIPATSTLAGLLLIYYVCYDEDLSKERAKNKSEEGTEDVADKNSETVSESDSEENPEEKSENDVRE